jgi:hypothetical protein
VEGVSDRSILNVPAAISGKIKDTKGLVRPLAVMSETRFPDRTLSSSVMLIEPISNLNWRSSRCWGLLAIIFGMVNLLISHIVGSIVSARKQPLVSSRYRYLYGNKDEYGHFC